MLELKGINKTYKSIKTTSTEALKNVNINFGKSGLTFILGKSGSGKSTLLNILGGLDTPTSGEIVFKGKSFKDFKSRDYDSYRNTSVGFVFQEYNLIEKYNVFDNVSYALKLQTDKIDENIVLDVLDKVGLKELAKRKVNELSGGQKQRVAIARALVKNPSIILADEPTGNLDSENSKMIFEILKNLSQERLVIVVSHDEECASFYGDRIIELQDGVVIRDTNPDIVNDDSVYSLKKNHLPFKEALRFSVKNLFGHKVKLVLSIILISFALSFLGLSVMQNYLKVDSESKRVIEDFDIKYLTILKLTKEDCGFIGKGYNIQCSNLDKITNDDYQNLTKEKNTKVQKGYFLNGLNYYIVGLERNFTEEENSDKIGYYYSKYEHVRSFSELDSNDFNFKLIGRKPENYNEIVIIKPVADFLIKYGYTLYNETDEEVIYKPTSYEEIVNDQKELKFGYTKIKIVGIIDDDLKEFEPLKNVSSNELRTIKDEKILKLKEKYDALYPVEYYALSGFKDGIDLNIPKQNRVSVDDYDVDLKVIDDKGIYTKNGLQSNISLTESDVVINIEYLDKITNNDFTKEMNEYVITGLENNSANSKEFYKEEFIKDYLSKNKLDVQVIFDIDDYGNKKQKLLNVVGITEDDAFYSNEKLLDEYSDERYRIFLYVLTKDIDNYDDYFEEYPLDKAQFVSDSNLLHVIAGQSSTMQSLSKYILIISLVFSLFAILLLFNFIGLSITDNKKEIGVLRALGTTKKDISKIYSIQGLLVGLVSYVISLFLTYYYAIGENNVIFNSENTSSIFRINLVGLTSQSILIMFAFMVIVVLLSALSVSFKISKMKPIDAINNK